MLHGLHAVSGLSRHMYLLCMNLFLHLSYTDLELGKSRGVELLPQVGVRFTVRAPSRGMKKNTRPKLL